MNIKRLAKRNIVAWHSIVDPIQARVYFHFDCSRNMFHYILLSLVSTTNESNSNISMCIPGNPGNFQEPSCKSSRDVYGKPEKGAIQYQWGWAKPLNTIDNSSSWHHFLICGAPPPSNPCAIHVESIQSEELKALKILHRCPAQYSCSISPNLPYSCQHTNNPKTIFQP